MLCWGYRRNFHIVCWDAVGCGFGTTSFNFGITYVCLITRILHVFAAGALYQHWYFHLCQKYHLKIKTKLKRNPCRFKILMGSVGKKFLPAGIRLAGVHWTSTNLFMRWCLYFSNIWCMLVGSNKPNASFRLTKWLYVWSYIVQINIFRVYLS